MCHTCDIPYVLRLTVFVCGCLFLIINNFAAAFAQAESHSTSIPAPDSGTPFVEMEPYVVRADRILPEPESWFYIKVPELALDRKTNGERQAVVFPGYEILYSGREQDARVLIRELQTRQAVSNFLFPMLVRRLPEQEIMYVYNDHYRYLHKTRYDPKTDNIWDSHIQREADNVLFQNYKKYGAKEIIAGYVFGRRVIYGTGERGEGAAGEAKLAWLITMDDSLRWNKFAQSSDCPYWLAIGFYNLFSRMRFDANSVSFGDIMKEGQLVDGASFGVDLPRLADMLRHEPRGGAAAYSYYFIHYGLFGNKGANREKITALIELMGGAKPFSEELFQKAWGKSSRQVDHELNIYARGRNMQKIVYKIQMPEIQPVVLRKATQSEIARLKAWLYFSRIQMPRALDELRIAYLRGEREPDMLALLAWLEQRMGSEDRARKILKALMALPKPPPETHIVAARFRFKEMLAAKLPGEKLSASESSELITTLGGALAGGLTTEELCGALAEVFLKSEGPPDANIAGFLAEAAKRYPHNQAIAAALHPGK